jgi:hypothetical protein
VELHSGSHADGPFLTKATKRPGKKP